MSNNVSFFGIRHHGPGSAYSLIRSLEETQPDIILVEGPPDAQELIPWMGNAALQPPVAILIYIPEQPQKAVYYPFADFSPEWQAIKFGISRKIPTRFMDLPQAYQLAAEKELPAIPNPPENGETLSALIRTVDPLSWLAEIAGFSDSERWWEHLIEQRLHSGEDIFAGIQEMMTALRNEEQNESSDKSVFTRRPFEAEREAYMRKSIRETQSQGYQKIAVVCGAWHIPALAMISDEKADNKILHELSKTKVSCAWVPWSYGRLSWDSGYGAGIESPGWYEALWNALRDEQSPSDLTIHWITRVAHLLREKDLPASSAHIIETVRLAETIATMRNQRIPGLAEMNEAIQAVFCFGDALPMALIHDELIIHDRLGKVPENVPMTPLQEDLARLQKHLRFPAEAAQKQIDLDLRNQTDLNRSYLLHRLDILEIPWGIELSVQGKSGSFHEFWQVQWQPELAIKVVEASQWGNSVQSAAIAYISHSLNQADTDLPKLTDLVNKSLLADLPDAVESLMHRLDSEAALSNDIGLLMIVVPSLAGAMRYGNVRQTDTEMIANVIHGLVTRICIGLPAACSSLNDEAANEIYNRIQNMHNAIGLLQVEEWSNQWFEVLYKFADQKGLHGLLAGKACALLLDKRIIDAEETSRRLGLALTLANDPSQAAAWVEGLLKNSGALLIHENILMKVMDEWISKIPADTFTVLLPLLRRTFSTFSPAERRLIGEHARQGSVIIGNSTDITSDFDFERADAVLPILAKLLNLQLGEEK
jgi:hypothetical protein